MNFDEFHKWTHKELGVDLTAYKPAQLNRRIESLMSRLGVKDLDEYTRLIKSDDTHRQKFLDFITINVTEFYRNPELFTQLEGIIKNEILPKQSSLKIWSAACSVGCEPYSIAMIMNKLTPLGRHTILATDIDTTILEKAKKGEYLVNEIKNVKKDEVEKYFRQEGNSYKISNEIISKVTFKKHDLILDRYQGDFDLILCRNVVIYFKNDIKNVIYKRFSESLKKGGLLFVGATESIYNYKEYGFEKLSTFIYKKL